MKKLILLAILNSAILPATNLFAAANNQNQVVDLKKTAQKALIRIIGSNTIYYITHENEFSQKEFLISLLNEIVKFYRNNPRAANYVNISELDRLIQTNNLDSLKTPDEFLKVVKLNNILCDMFGCDQAKLNNYVNAHGLAIICVKILQDDKTVYAEDISAVLNLENISELTGVDKLLMTHFISSCFPARPGNWLQRKLSYLTSPLSKLNSEQLNKLYGACVAAGAGSAFAIIIHSMFPEEAKLAAAGTGLAASGASYLLMRNPTWSKVAWANIVSNVNLRKLLFKRNRFSYDKFIASLSYNQKNMFDAKTLADAELKPTLLINNKVFMDSLSNEQLELLFEVFKNRSVKRDDNWLRLIISLTEDQQRLVNVNKIFLTDLQDKSAILEFLNLVELIVSLNDNQTILLSNFLASKNINIDSLENFDGSINLATVHHKLIKQKYNAKFNAITQFVSGLSTIPQYRAFDESLSLEQRLILETQMFVKENWAVVDILQNSKFMEMLSPDQIVLLDDVLTALVDTKNQTWVEFINSLTGEQQVSIFNNKFAYKCFLGVYDISLVTELLNTAEFVQILTDDQKIFLRNRI